MKRILLLCAAFIGSISSSFSQVTSISVEEFYTDDASVTGYPADHTTYRIYANCTNEEDRVTSISGNDDAPLILTVSGGLWNHPAGNVVGNAVNCSLYGAIPAVEYDSYITLDYTCNDGSTNTIYSVEDVAQPWKTAVFNTSPYGAENTILNTSIGGGWFGLPDADDDANDNTRAGLDLKVLIAQITIPNAGSICGIFNLQCFPNYQSDDDDYIVQTGFQFGTIDCGIPGCTDDTALNFDPAAAFDNGLCLFECGLSITNVVVVQPTCSYEDDGSISFAGTGGQDFIEYSFDGNVLGLSPEISENLMNGSYTISIRDTRFDNPNMNPDGMFGDCMVEQTIELNTEAIALNGATSTSVSCAGEGDGCAQLASADGGTGTLMFSLAYENDEPVLDGNGDALELDAPNYCGLDGDSYYFIAMDANGCTEVSELFEVIEPSSIVLLEGAELAASCFNSADGTQVFNFTGGSGTLSFELDGNGDYELEGGAFNVVLENLVPGDYTLYAIDENDCTGSQEFTIAGGPAIVIDADATGVLCNGDSNGSIVLNATGGSGEFTYSFDGDNYSSVNELNDVAAGPATVFVQDENGCIAEEEVMIDEPSELTAAAEATDILCAGDDNGSLIITATGGTELYAYSIDGIDYTPSPLFNDLAAGDYDIYVEDANGCTYSMTGAAAVTEPDPLTGVSVATGVTCNGDDDGEILVTALGGTAPYEYSTGGAPDDANPITGLDPDTYDVVITDANGCEYTVMNVEVTEPDPLVIDGLGPDPINNTPGGNTAYTVDGGTPPYGYEWIYDGDVISTDQDLDDITDAADQGAYTLTVTDANGCEVSQTINITGVGELGQLYSISLYPNPSNGLFVLNIAGVQGEKMSYTISDEAGRIVTAKELGNVSGTRIETVDAAACAAGVYYITLQVGNNTHTSKLIIE